MFFSIPESLEQLQRVLRMQSDFVPFDKRREGLCFDHAIETASIPPNRERQRRAAVKVRWRGGMFAVRIDYAAPCSPYSVAADRTLLESPARKTSSGDFPPKRSVPFRKKTAELLGIPLASSATACKARDTNTGFCVFIRRKKVREKWDSLLFLFCRGDRF